MIERTDPSGQVFEEEVYDINIVEEDGRSLSGMVTVLAEAVKALHEENQQLKADLTAIKAKLGIE